MVEAMVKKARISQARCLQVSLNPNQHTSTLSSFKSDAARQLCLTDVEAVPVHPIGREGEASSL